MYLVIFWNLDRARPRFVGLTTFKNVLDQILNLRQGQASFCRIVAHQPMAWQMWVFCIIDFIGVVFHKSNEVIF